MSEEKEPRPLFTAEDFDDTRFKKLKEKEAVERAMATAWEWAAFRANARLAPLVEALDRLDLAASVKPSSAHQLRDAESNLLVAVWSVLKERSKLREGK